jgi:aminomethyltransferase
MGQIEVRGPDALDLVELVTCNRAAKLKDGQAQYSGLLNPDGGFIDDLLVHRIDDQRYFLCVNAANQDRDFQWIRSHNDFDAEVEFLSEQYALLAIQGPQAKAVVRQLTAVDIDSLHYYWFAEGDFAGVPAIIARTGYTGEDGFETYIPAAAAERVWGAILKAGAELGILPCGLGARNTLRLEAAMSLHGHEISEQITPWEGGLGWIVKMNKGDFIGRDALDRQLGAGVRRKIAGFEMRGRGIGRDGYPVQIEGKQVGHVTSGGPAPALDKNIGIAMLPADQIQLGRPIDILVRNRAVEAEIVKTPFYTRKKV